MKITSLNELDEKAWYRLLKVIFVVFFAFSILIWLMSWEWRIGINKWLTEGIFILAIFEFIKRAFYYVVLGSLQYNKKTLSKVAPIILGVICFLFLIGNVTFYYAHALPQKELEQKTEAEQKKQDELNAKIQADEAQKELTMQSQKWQLPPPTPTPPPSAEILNERASFKIDTACKALGEKYMSNVYKNEDKEGFWGWNYYGIFYSPKKACLLTSYQFGESSISDSQAILSLTDIATGREVWSQNYDPSPAKEDILKNLDEQIRNL